MNLMQRDYLDRQARQTRIVGAVLVTMAFLLLTSCSAVQSLLSAATGGAVPRPTPESAHAGAVAWSAWLTWLGHLVGITDPQAATAVTVAAYSRVDNAVKGVVAAVKGTKRVVQRRRAKKAAAKVGFA
jgi:hypothetical protein